MDEILTMQKKFSERLAICLDENKESINEFVQNINVTSAIIPHILAGSYSPNVMTLIKIADYFGCSIDYLLGRSNTFSQM